MYILQCIEFSKNQLEFWSVLYYMFILILEKEYIFDIANPFVSKDVFLLIHITFHVPY